jgi:tetratricopeptide (TPR) repeat protein
MALLAVLALTALVYARVATYDLIIYDDHAYLSDNQVLTQSGYLAALRWSLTTHLGGNWHPLVWWTFLGDRALHGLSPGGLHLTNLLWHLLSVLLAYAVGRALGVRPWPAVAVAALFALHPLRVESVAWIAERKDVVSGATWLLTLLAWAAWCRRPGWGRYALALLAYAAALMSKPMVVTLPCVLLLLDIWPLRRASWPLPGGGAPWRARLAPWPRLLAEKLPFFALAAAASAYTLHAQQNVGAVFPQPLALRLQNALVSYATYLGQTVWPARLQVFYPYPDAGLPSWQVALAAALLVALTALVWWRREAQPALAVGWLWFLGTLVPVIGLVQVGAQAHADRYTYLPHLGLLLALAHAWPEAAWPRRRRVLPLATALALLALAAATWRQVSHWRDTRALFGHAIAVNPANLLAYVNLGNQAGREGDHQEAMRWYDQALVRNPHYFHAVNNKGLSLLRLQRPAEALPFIEEARRLSPGHADVPATYGLALLRLGRHAEAIPQFELALRRQPDHPDILANLGVACYYAGRLDRAREALERALQRRPGDATFLLHLGQVAQAQGQPAAAGTHYRAALARQPDDPVTLVRLAALLCDLGRHAEALPYLERVLARDPDHADALNNLGVVRAVQGDLPAAEAAFRRALALKPELGSAAANLAQQLDQQERSAEALPLYEAAVQHGFRTARVHFRLAFLYHRANRLADAVTQYRAALALDPRLDAAERNLATALFSLGDLAAAEPHFLAALRLAPNIAETHNNYGALLIRQQRYPEAAAAFRRALELNPAYADAQQNLARTQRHLSATTPNAP